MTTTTDPSTIAAPANADGGSISIFDPSDGSLVGTVAAAGPEEVANAVGRARAAAPDWAATSPQDRGTLLKQAARALAARAGELAEWNQRETGKLLEEALGGVLAGVATLEQYAELGPVHRGRSLRGAPTATDYTVAGPRGVVAAVTPWNDPVAVACGLLGAAVVTGNTVVHKPSERCPHTGALLGSVLASALPENILVTVTGGASAGASLAAGDVDVVAHVGSSATGAAIHRACAQTGAHTVLENGGNDPLLVDGDVDPAWAAGQAALGAFANTGQICTSVERIYVHEAVATDFIAALETEARQRNETGSLGPLVDERHRAAVHAHVADAVSAGARATVGGTVPDRPGTWYPATVLLDCTEDMDAMREETFGPVAPVRVVESFEEGLRLAAAGRYGLAATVLTGSLAHAQQAVAALPVGTVKVNHVFGGAPGGSAQPRGASGRGFGYGPELLDEMTTVKVVHLEAPGGGTAAP
ncbi:aldehyde dehydrogenase [Paenarthrobacter sp. DKR-5]|uniref:aldehyde dehydrogenase family protein n=1 Tax=Paenarthrobacter sp. DKR-5 TaxID=2835535 RepID=UPI001BDDAD50|nr:aldehyde dehydrogenase family protein [Paenarthrobacter sp. DKR-5]MBT1001516.1 aldehyde dehydrogenase [Paenarthrobacter sp. DKR-5]